MQLFPLTKLKSAFCALLLLISSLSYSQVQVWGTSQTGGSDAIGSVYSVLDDGSEYTLKSSFINSQEGANPKSSLVVTDGGVIYGISAQGGANNSGTIFRYSEGEFEVLYQLNLQTDGGNTSADFIQIDEETFVGATFNGGENGGGVLFEYSLNTGFNALFHFDADNSGSNPTGGLVHEDGNIYGTCSNGGLFGFGSVWRYTGLNLNILHNFQGGESGSYPRSGVILADDGDLYGAAQFGGVNNQGTIFKIGTDGSGFETLYNLNSTTSDGRYPLGKLVESSPGTFLGTCSEGGSSGSGTVFSITAGGEYSVLKSLLSPVDGGFPKTGLSQEIDGKFYGVTEFGGSNGFGTIFSVEESGNFSAIHNFNYTSDGANPQSSLTVDGENLFGATTTGGANNFGTLISFNTDNQVEKLHDFSLPLNGSAPEGIVSAGNSFYGITSTGGDFNTGTFYRVELSGERTKLHDFDQEMEGQNPNGDLFWSEENDLFYGAARFGGLMESGSVFSLNESGALTTLHFFEGGVAGEFPYSSPTLHSNGNLYGTTLTGGTFGDGVLYSIDPEGNYEVLFNFFGFFDGASCESQLVETEDGKLYGLCAEGGSFNAGSLFQFDTETNTLTVVHNFNTISDGSVPKGKLLLHSDGKLYGTTREGVNGGGSIFRYSEADGFELLHAFNPGTEGFFANGGLVEDENGGVYGVCSQGGANSFGTCFKYTEADGLELIYTFSGLESPNPSGSVALFFPECYGDDECVSEDPCSVAICDFGVCTEVPINPAFTVLNTGICQVGLNQFEMELQMDLDISPGGSVNIAGQNIPLFEEINSYQFTLTLDADGEAIDLNYSFSETGCEGSTGELGTAPAPCPPIEVTFILDVNDLDVSPEGIHLGGNFQGWTPSELPMTDMGDGIWEITTDIGSGSYEYNFFDGNNLFDAEYVIGECADNGKRQLDVGEESFTVEACWESCNANCSLGLVENSLQKSIELYPNVGTSGFEVQLIIGEPIVSGTYEIIDATGRKVIYGPAYQGRNSISTSTLTSGLFHIIIYENGGALAAKRLIVQ
jgi:uncharacterized repeat protein (TIGR03803 family)